MQSLTLTGRMMLVATLLTGCGADLGPADEIEPRMAARSHPNTTVHNSFVTAVDEVSDESPCNGEKIHFTGTASTRIVFVASPDTLFQHAVLQMVFKATGIGLTTGTPYTVHVNFYEGFTLPYGHEQYQSFSFHEKVRVMSHTPGLSFGSHLQVHFVGVPDGDGKFTRIAGAEECFT